MNKKYFGKVWKISAVAAALIAAAWSASPAYCAADKSAGKGSHEERLAMNTLSEMTKNVRSRLSAQDIEKIEAAAKAAAAKPEVKAALKALADLRKPYYTEYQMKFPEERNMQVARDFNAARKKARTALLKAMLEADPQVGPLLNPKMNEGEGIADSDIAENPAMAPVKDVAGLPRVLLIGDSISIGYTPYVRERLKGVANVHRIPQNGGATEVGLAKMADWLDNPKRYGDGKWDVIHFNFGLHDAKHKNATQFRASREEYAENLRKLVAQMKATGATLIWASTTPLPDKITNPGRKFDDISARNEIAKKVMEENGVIIEDLNALVLPCKNEIQNPGDVHFKAAGYALLADEIAKNISEALKTRSKSGK